MAVTDRSVTSRTVAQHIESVTYHSVSARTILRRLQQSGLPARYPLLGLPLTQNTNVSAANGAMKEECGRQKGMKLYLLTSLRICLQHHDGWIRVWRHLGDRMVNSCVMHRHTGPAPGIMVWFGIAYPSRTPLVRIVGFLNSQRYISVVLEPVVPFLSFRVWPQPYFNRIMCNHT
ncbi:transposable element Tcb1 transposase [Trichonephila clavipes]|nr:transposable element Tcb1 transposase [Trichonephila clavipes]